MKDIEEGDIVLATPADASLDDENQYVLVFEVLESAASCILITLRTDLAIELDLVLPSELTGLSNTVTIHTMTESVIPRSRLSRAIAHCGDEVLQEILDLRYSEPSQRFQYGEETLPLGDPRERELTVMYRNFRELFEVREHEKSRQPVKVILDGSNLAGLGHFIADASPLERQRIREMLEMRDSMDELARSDTAAIDLSAIAQLAPQFD